MHKAQALVVTCIDFRFQGPINEDLVRRGIDKKSDRISWPGASKDIDTLIPAAELSLKRHQPDEVIIIEHVDCAAYGKDNSLGAHRENAEKLAQALRKIKPGLKVETLIATFDSIQPLG